MNRRAFPHRTVVAAVLLLVATGSTVRAAEPFDAAPFGLPLPEGNGLLWEDPREIHRVVVHFKEAPTSTEKIRLEYWGSKWPEQHLPKDKEPGGADVGWMELGNWWKYGWRVADADIAVDNNALTFTFRPVDAKEFPKVKGYSAKFRYTLKIRVASDAPLPPIQRTEAFTDSKLEERAFRIVAEKSSQPQIAEVFNGRAVSSEKISSRSSRFGIQAAVNSDPNTFDRTLVTLQRVNDRFTIRFDDLAGGPLFLPHLGLAVLPDTDTRDYATVAADQKARGSKTLYDRVAETPEQTWQNAWNGVPRKKSDIYFPLGLDGGRQRFRLDPNGSIRWRSNDNYLKRMRGADTPRLELEKSPLTLKFNLPDRPSHRTLDDESLPICTTTWDVDGIRVEQTAFVTPLEGTRAESPTPAADTFTVFIARFTFSNTTAEAKIAKLPIAFGGGPEFDKLRIDDDGLIWNDDHVRGHVEQQTPVAGGRLKSFGELPARESVSIERKPQWTGPLASHESRAITLKIPYVPLTEAREADALKRLNFETERGAAAGYWRRRLDESAKLITPEPMLNEFYRSHAMHLLVNCEREPNSERRFARVGSFGYGAYGNESVMMVVDLERRGYHREAQDCLDAWLHYQSTVGLPGSFASQDGVLYGAGGYEAGGYNQHHGWILWMMGEHYRFTRDRDWLQRAAPGIVKACDWIIRESARTKTRHELERGLLPAGSLEDIGDWWTWLSTSCYTWRGLDSAAWALEQIKHPDAKRIRKAADEYRATMLANFHKASELAPVVRLRDGTAIPKIPSHVHRRGRCFGWICETLEGSIHLLITGAIDPHSREADWILQDYEDNLYISNQYGYMLKDFDKEWFGRGGFSMQACLLLDVEPYLYRDDVKHALRSLFNGEAVSYFPDVRMNTEHAAPTLADWRGDHFKSSDEANCAGWLRYLFVREQGDELLIGQAVPREWLAAGKQCGIEGTSTYFGKTSVLYTGGENEITARLDAPKRNPPKKIHLRFRDSHERPLRSVTVNGKRWKNFKADWVELPGDIGTVTMRAQY